jgi:APA family basic amino acid/polyamine antiporter
MLGMLVVLVIYFLLQLIVQGVLGANLSLFKEAPLAEVAKTLFGKPGVAIITAGTAISMFGGMSGAVMTNPRVLFAGARDSIMPRFLGRVHPKYTTPYLAILIYTGLGFLFAIGGSFRQLIVLTTASVLVIYIGVMLATIRLRNKKFNNSEKTFRAPGGIIVPILAICGIVWLLSNLQPRELAAVMIFIGVFVLVYFIMKAVKKKQFVRKVRSYNSSNVLTGSFPKRS